MNIKKWYLIDNKQNEKQIILNDIVNTITFYIKLNFLSFGVWQAQKINNNSYYIIDKFTNNIDYKIIKK